MANKSLTILEEYNHLKLLIETSHQKQMEDLEAFFEIKRKTCKHKFKIVKELFYALGETCDGKKCTECGQERHL